MDTETSELEKLEILITSYRNEQDTKKRDVMYLHLVEESLKLVKKIVATIYPIPSSVSKEDLVQVGAIGALKAIDTYKMIGKGSFKTYATKYIRGKILQYLRDKANIVKPPRETSENIAKIKNAIEDLSESGGDTTDIKHISQIVGLPENKVEEIINGEIVKNIVSLDQKIYSSDGTETLLDIIKAENNNYEEKYENKKILEYALNKLSKQEREIICRYYISGMTKRDISKEEGISAMQVGRIIKKSLNKMYKILTEEC